MACWATSYGIKWVGAPQLYCTGLVPGIGLHHWTAVATPIGSERGVETVHRPLVCGASTAVARAKPCLSFTSASHQTVGEYERLPLTAAVGGAVADPEPAAPQSATTETVAAGSNPLIATLRLARPLADVATGAVAAVTVQLVW